MPEIKVKSIIGALAISVMGIALCIGTAFIFASRVSISMPILFISILLSYLIVNMIIFPKIRVVQLLKLSTASSTFFLIISGVSYLIFHLLNLHKIIISSNMDISANSAYFLISVLFGILSSVMLLKLEIIKRTEPIKQTRNLSENNINDETPINEETIKPQDLIINAEIPTVLKKEIITENYPNTKTYLDNKETDKIKTEQELKSSNNQDSSSNNLETLPDIKLEETSISSNNDELKQDISCKYNESIFDDNDIPDNIRLSDNQRINKTESKGMISSIGKLLINNRDIENIIETNELMQQIGCSSDDIDIVTMTSGIKIYEKFNRIMVEYTQIKDLTLSNKAGFTIASIIKDSRRSETIGAIASSAFLVLKNYLERLEICNLQKVFFEAEDGVYSLFKIDDFILFFISEENFEPINYTLVKEILAQNNISNQDLSVIKNIKGIIES
ncbi:MAG: hypothetical protein PHC34_03940, partial [Candidatus Gastranaerophilales bacterium]|nr:hypothetical protein [Candidatus Gastranaerophilales bacterium]